MSVTSKGGTKTWRLDTLRVILGGLPSSTCISMSMGVVVEVAIGHHQLAIVRGRADHGKRAALTLADGLEDIQALRRNRQHVTLLGFVGPDLPRAHARLVDVHLAQLEARTQLGGISQLREGVGQAAGTHVVDGRWGWHRPSASRHR
jgi:hypothetical protein